MDLPMGVPVGLRIGVPIGVCVCVPMGLRIGLPIGWPFPGARFRRREEGGGRRREEEQHRTHRRPVQGQVARQVAYRFVQIRRCAYRFALSKGTVPRVLTSALLRFRV